MARRSRNDANACGRSGATDTHDEYAVRAPLSSADARIDGGTLHNKSEAALVARIDGVYSRAQDARQQERRGVISPRLASLFCLGISRCLAVLHELCPCLLACAHSQWQNALPAAQQLLDAQTLRALAVHSKCGRVVSLRCAQDIHSVGRAGLGVKPAECGDTRTCKSR